MIDKIQAYEEFGQNWQNQLVLAADLNDPAAGDFSAANARLAALTDGRRGAGHHRLNETAVTPAATKLVSYFNSGAGIIHYTGHGGAAANWSGQSLLRASDVASACNRTGHRHRGVERPGRTV